MPARWLLPLLSFAFVCLARADGPAHNPLDKVRPVPPKGITVAEADRSALQSGIDLNNARQVPKLPDFAVIDVNVPVSSRAPGSITTAGFLTEDWELPVVK